MTVLEVDFLADAHVLKRMCDSPSMTSALSAKLQGVSTALDGDQGPSGGTPSEIYSILLTIVHLTAKQLLKCFIHDPRQLGD